MLIPLKKPIESIISTFTTLANAPYYLHRCFEDFIDRGEDSDDVKVKKKMLLYYVYTTVVYSMCLPLFNPYVTTKQTVFETIFAVCQLLMIKVKNYNVLMTYFILYTFLSIYLPVSRDDELLKGIGVALMHHNLFFLFPDNIVLKLFYIFMSQWLIKGTEPRVLALLKGEETEIMQAMVKSFYSSWPLIYIVNHISSMHLVRAFQKAMRTNKCVENQLKEINKQLIETNQKLANALSVIEKSNQDLKDALKGRELFIASASHELRNPLNSMIGNIELVRLDTKDPKLLKMLENCKVCGEVLLALINNILDVAKINAEKLELHYLPGDFLEVIEKVWTISSFKIKEKGLKGEIFLAHNFPKCIEMDSHRLTQILLNLIGNSAKFTNKGYIKVIVTWHANEAVENLKSPHEEFLKMVQKARLMKSDLSTQETQDRIDKTGLTTEGPRSIDLERESDSRVLYPKFFSQMLASNFCHLSLNDVKLNRMNKVKQVKQERRGIIKIQIIDTGCGISCSGLQHLFQPFCQADSSIARKFGGTGLGLYISQQLLRKMGGEIFVYSQENVGTNFCILLPAVIATEDKESPRQTEKQPYESRPAKNLESGPMRVLVADDDPFNRSIFADYMKKLNILVDSAINGQEALQIFISKGEGYYSFITMDLEMPVMDGFTACREIRKYEARAGMKSVPIIVITGNCTEAEQMECLDPSGGIRAFEFFRKPFTFNECQTCVQTVVKRKKLQNSKKTKLLTISNSSFNTGYLQQYLEKHGFECEICFNAEEALEMVYGGRFNAVLIDCEMPRIDGCMMAKLIKQRYPQILVLGLAGRIGDGFKVKAKMSGMNIVGAKPINPENLVNILIKDICL